MTTTSLANVCPAPPCHTDVHCGHNCRPAACLLAAVQLGNVQGEIYSVSNVLLPMSKTTLKKRLAQAG